MSTNSEVEGLAEACAARLQVGVADTATPEPCFKSLHEFKVLLDAVRQLDPQFAFDRDGRPGAIAAVREALPAVERDLLDAIIEDHESEIAAIHEAVFHIVRAAARLSAR